jgi:GNAT superfamily N-acetyltransferase
MQTTIHRFDPGRRADFFRLHNEAHEAGWCFCVAWWVASWEGFGERTAEDNRVLRDSLLDRGEYDGYLLYADGVPAGWCQVGPRDRLGKLVQQFGLDPDPATWAITCFLIAPAWRGQGLATRLLEGVLADLVGRSVRRVEAYPKRGPDLDALDLWTGPEALFQRAGFRVVRDDPQRPVLALELV